MCAPSLAPARSSDSGPWSLEEIDARFERVHGIAGSKVKTLPDGCAIHMLVMLFNYRIVREDEPGISYDRAYCYFGRDAATLSRAMRAAVAWDGADATEPEGWDKRLAGPPGTSRSW